MENSRDTSKEQPSAVGLRLRTQLFLGSAFLSSAILIVAAWVINNQVVNQARQQVHLEVETLLPVYDAIWQEYSQSLSALGQTMAASAVVKTIFGDPRASRDRATLHEMINDFNQELAAPVSLLLITDNAGRTTFAELGGKPFEIAEVNTARQVAETQQQHRSFTLIGGKLFHLVLTPVLVHSGSIDYQNTLVVLGTGAELDRGKALEIKRRMHSDVLFLADNHLYASSLSPAVEGEATRTALSTEVRGADPAHPVEIRLNGEPYLAFARDLKTAEGQLVGQVVVLRSLAGAGLLFQAISNRLLLLWSLSIAAALLLSYLIANRITRPIDQLVAGVEEFGRGNDGFQVPAKAAGEIGTLARSFDTMRRSLKQTQTALLRSERMATIGQMASSIVHDLRNPLATITTAAEVLNRDGIDRERRQSLFESQLRASYRMNEMLRELLDFSRGNYKLNLTRQSISEIVDRAILELKPGILRAGVKIETQVPDHFHVLVDAERLRRVFENLLLNAAQAVPEGGEIKVRAELVNGQPDRVRIDFLDNGPGITPEIRERIFEPFVSYGKAGGTGLGLAIADRVVSGHGGELGLDPNFTTGSNFFVVLPLQADELGG